MKKTISIIICAVLCISFLASCGGNPAPAAPTSAATPTPDIMGSGKTAEVGTKVDATKEVKYKEDLTVIVDNTDMKILNPAHSSGAGQGSVMNYNCYANCLVGYENGKIVPELAESWDVKDFQHYTFKLRDDVYFHNGEKFTADDVVFTIENAMANTGSTASARLGYVESYDIADDYTITLHLNQVNSDFLDYLYSPICSIVNREAVEADPDKGTWIGTGPWIIEEFASNEYCQLKVNEDYWGELPKAKSLRFIKVGEEATRYMMLMNDEVDVAFGCSPADFKSIADDPDFELYTYTICNVGYIGFNMTDPLTSDINFRRAVACLLKRQDYIDSTRYGYAAAPPSGAYWGHSTTCRNMDLPLQEYDVDLAKEYLAKSSYDGKSEVSIAAALGEFKTIAQFVQAELINIGVNCKYYETDMAGFNALTDFSNNKSQIVSTTGQWTDYPSSSIPYFSVNNKSNKVSYVNQEVIDLLKLASSTLDPTERENSYKKAQQLVYDDVVYVPTMSISHGVGCPNEVGGLILTSDNMHDLSHMFRVIED